MSWTVNKGLQIFLLLTVLVLRLITASVLSGEIISCAGWRLNHLPELRRFLKEVRYLWHDALIHIISQDIISPLTGGFIESNHFLRFVKTFSLSTLTKSMHFFLFNSLVTQMHIISRSPGWWGGSRNYFWGMLMEYLSTRLTWQK